MIDYYTLFITVVPTLGFLLLTSMLVGFVNYGRIKKAFLQNDDKGKAALAAKEAELAGLKLEKEAVDDALAKSKSENAGLTSKLGKHGEIKDKYNSLSTALENMKANFDKLSSKRSSYEKEREKCSAQVSDMLKVKTELESELEDLREKNLDLKLKVINLIREKDNVNLEIMQIKFLLLRNQITNILPNKGIVSVIPSTTDSWFKLNIPRPLLCHVNFGPIENEENNLQSSDNLTSRPPLLKHDSTSEQSSETAMVVYQP